MGCIQINDLHEGMTLTRDLRTPQGRMLLPKGTRLTRKHFRILRIWGVTDAHVDHEKGHSQADQESIPPAVMREAKKLALQRFRSCALDEPFGRELAVQFARRTAHNAMAGHYTLQPHAPAVAAPLSAGRPGEPPTMASLTSADAQLASLPDMFARILEAVNNPRSSAASMAEVISSDPNLSARLLRLVNSPHFGLSRKVDTVHRAVAMAGSRQLIALAASLSVLTMFKDIPKEYIDMEAFWRHSIACGVAARLIGDRIGGHGDRLFACGLLHDIGRVIMLRSAPDLSLHTLATANTSGRPLHVVEKELWGYDHGLLSGAILDAWRLPEPIVQAVRKHHSAADTTWNNVETACIHVADGVARCLDVPGAAAPMPALQQSAWNATGLSHSSIAQLLDQTGKQTADLITLLHAVPATAARRKAS